jgi:LysM repeat protein
VNEASTVAYVEPRPFQHDFGSVFRSGTRLVAVAVYAAAVATFFVLLGPVLFDGNSGAAVELPKAPNLVVASVKPGEAAISIATKKGVSPARLYALNPALTPFGVPGRARIVVGLH